LGAKQSSVGSASLLFRPDIMYFPRENMSAQDTSLFFRRDWIQENERVAAELEEWATVGKGQIAVFEKPNSQVAAQPESWGVWDLQLSR
jgi:hypothetical protein